MTIKSRAVSRLRRHARVRKRVFGTPKLPRLAVFKSLSEIYAQVIDDVDGNTLIAASTLDGDLREKVKGMKKVEQAREVGKTLAQRASKKGIAAVVFDRGGNRYSGRIKALADSAREAGLKF